jgi:hypothetical protein
VIGLSTIARQRIEHIEHIDYLLDLNKYMPIKAISQYLFVHHNTVRYWLKGLRNFEHAYKNIKNLHNKIDSIRHDFYENHVYYTTRPNLNYKNNHEFNLIIEKILKLKKYLKKQELAALLCVHLASIDSWICKYKYPNKASIKKIEKTYQNLESYKTEYYHKLGLIFYETSINIIIG